MLSASAAWCSSISDQMEFLPMTISKAEKTQSLIAIALAVPATAVVLAISLVTFGFVA